MPNEPFCVFAALRELDGDRSQLAVAGDAAAAARAGMGSCSLNRQRRKTT